MQGIQREYPFGTAYMEARAQFGLELDQDEFESIAITAWKKIGNQKFKLYKERVKPIQDEKNNNLIYKVPVPWNCDHILSVTADFEDYQRTSNYLDYPDPRVIWQNDYIERFKLNESDLYQRGSLINYRIENDEDEDMIVMLDFHPYVNILFRGVVVDDRGLPMLTDSETNAVAAYCALTRATKDYFTTSDQKAMQKMQLLEIKWKKACNQARIPEYLDDNDMNKVLDAKSTCDRKIFGRSYKAIH